MTHDSTRREFIGGLAAAATSLALPGSLGFAQAGGLLVRSIPASGRSIPVIGMGTWITFNVGENAKLRDARTAVMKEFFAQGGALIDSSPMYGSSEAVVGHGLARLGHPKALFAATKVWTSSSSEGLAQIKDSQELWGVKVFDLFQIHNLVGWEDHLKTLLAMKAKGELTHVGIATSHGRRHGDLEKIMRAHPIDFVQLTYNIQEREAEARLLPLALERKIAVIVNRPYEGGELITRLKSRKAPLPPWAKDVGCDDWATFLLKFIVSHPGVTCAIPATSKVERPQGELSRAPREIRPARRRALGRRHDSERTLVSPIRARLGARPGLRLGAGSNGARDPRPRDHDQRAPCGADPGGAGATLGARRGAHRNRAAVT